MEIELDTKLWANHAPGKPARDAAVHPDWHGLRARLFAVRSAHHALAGQYIDDAIPANGSFDGAAADAVLALRAASETVNPSSWCDGKSVAVKDAGIAGPISTGDRG